MDLEGIRFLIRVVELGSVQRAAHQLGLSRTSLTRKLENLEAEVGSELFVRSTTGMTLTAAGSVVLEEGRTLLERYARMVSSVKSAADTPEGRVRVVIPAGMPDGARVGMLRALQSIAPGLGVDEVEHANPLLHLHEPFDLMFHNGEPPARGEWFSRLVWRKPLVALASQAYLSEFGRPASTAELARHRLLSWHLGNENPREWPLNGGGSLPVDPVFTSRDGQFLHHAAHEGLGILLGIFDPPPLSHLPPLVPVLESEIRGEVTFRCLSPIPANVRPASRAILASIQSVIVDMLPEA
jgi:molybdate transport repressor ModE-like protein